MIMENHMWLFAFLFTTGIGSYFLYLYAKSKDKKKLMFSIAFYLANLFFIAAFFDVVNQPNTPFDLFGVNIAAFSSLPLMFAVFFAVNETYLPLKPFDRTFTLFLLITSGCILLIFLPFSISAVTHLIRQILAIEILIVSLYLFSTRKNIEYLYFLFFILISIFAGFIYQINEAVSSFAFIISFLFLTLLFVPSDSQYSQTPLLKNYFSIQDKLKTVEARYRQLFNSLPDAVALLTKSGVILDINEVMAKNFQMERHEMIGKNIHCLLPEDVDKLRTKIGKTAMSTGEIQEFEDQRGDLWFHTLFVPVKSDAHEDALLIIAHDITQQRTHEQQIKQQVTTLEQNERATLNIMDDLQNSLVSYEQAQEEIKEKNTQLQIKTENLQMMNQELNVAREQLTLLNEDLEKKVQERTEEIKHLLIQKDKFIGQLGHDLKTPLTPLRTLLPLIQERVQDEKSRELLQITIDNTKYMTNLVQKTLKLAKLNSSVQDLQIEKITLYEELQLLCKNYKVKNESISIHINVPQNLILLGDRIQIIELFDNLISNAIKFSPGKCILHIEAYEELKSVIIFIRDNGIGLSIEQRDHIFDEFYKVDESRHDIGSTGLGLSICKRIVEKHHGKIWVESQGRGQGSTFFVQLPLMNQQQNYGVNEEQDYEENIVCR